MNMHELHNNLKESVGLAPVAAASTDNTAQTTAIVDMKGYHSVEWYIMTGTLADAACAMCRRAVVRACCNALNTATGGRPDGIVAAVHALFFYVAAGTVALWLLDIACGFVRADRRLGHDLLTGLVVVRA